MVIEIEDLCKAYKNVQAVDGLSFRVSEGELFAFLGVNGAGKSTTINIISGILPKDSGVVKVCGEDIETRAQSVKSKVGVVFQNSVLDKRLTVRDNLECRAALYGIYGKRYRQRLEEMDSLLGLSDILKRPLVKLSGGQRRRADIARALIHDPELLILDEPTTGLDPQTRQTVWRVIEQLRTKQGLTVFLTTHYMEEASVADHVIILHGGRKAAEGTPHELKTLYAKDTLRVYSHLDEIAAYLAERGYGISREKDCIDIQVKGTAEATGLIAARPELFDDYEVLKGDMDSVFLNVTDREITEE